MRPLGRFPFVRIDLKRCERVPPGQGGEAAHETLWSDSLLEHSSDSTSASRCPLCRFLGTIPNTCRFQPFIHYVPGSVCDQTASSFVLHDETQA